MAKKISGVKNISKNSPGDGGKAFESQGIRERIQKRAFEIYEERNRNHLPGDSVTDWIEAEQEIKSL